jgi:hypothetical protein
MNDLAKANELIDKNRLLVAISVAWVILSNLLYFSQLGKFSCSDPDWMIFWHKLTLGYVSLFESIHQPFQPGMSAFVIATTANCSQAGFSYDGYLSFVSLPIAAIILLTIAIKWVRRA